MKTSREVATSHHQGYALQDRPATVVRDCAVEAASLPNVPVALVHDWLITLGGAERALLALHRLYPGAPVFVALHDTRRLPDVYKTLDLRASWLQRFPKSAEHHRALVPLMPFAFRALDLRGYKIVISSSHACAKGVQIDRDAVHICYCHTPMRYVWDLAPLYRRTLSPWIQPVAQLAQASLRSWDRRSARGVTYFIANSRFVAERIRRHYHRQSTVIYPPVDVDYYTPGEGDVDDFFLIVSRLVPYKRVELAVEAFNQLGRRLVIVGDGPESPRLRALARPNVTLVGEVSDETLREYYRRCLALVFPGEEDFGIVPVEAHACGRPVIAFNGGGVRETVVDGRTGILFPQQSVTALAAAVRSFDPSAFDAGVIRRQAERFSERTFHTQISGFVWRVHQSPLWQRTKGSELVGERSRAG